MEEDERYRVPCGLEKGSRGDRTERRDSYILLCRDCVVWRLDTEDVDFCCRCTMVKFIREARAQRRWPEIFLQLSIHCQQKLAADGVISKAGRKPGCQRS